MLTMEEWNEAAINSEVTCVSVKQPPIKWRPYGLMCPCGCKNELLD